MQLRLEIGDLMETCRGERLVGADEDPQALPREMGRAEEALSERLDAASSASRGPGQGVAAECGA